MSGGLGNDIYVVDNAGDTITEGAELSKDVVQTSLASYTLGANLENLTGTLDTVQVLTGNERANVIIGGAGNDIIDGAAGTDTVNAGDGNDIVYGGLEADKLSGEGGNDFLYGGLGNDSLLGGNGADAFVFGQESVGRTMLAQPRDVDKILDLSFVAGDRIDLSGIDANALVAGDQAFSFVAKFTKAAGQAVLVFNATKNTTALLVDVDGDGKADFTLVANGNLTGTTGNLYTGGGDTDGGWVL
jgi:serralysin